MANICPTCMANMDMVGVSHRCIRRAKPVSEPIDYKAIREDIKDRFPDTLAVLGGTYKYRDADSRRAYMRDYMKRYRSS